MVKNSYKNIKIACIASAVSDLYLTIEDCVNKCGLTDFNIKKFIKSTSVKGKYICPPEQTPADLCFAAADEVIKKKNIDRNEIGVLIYVTQSPDYRAPATACVLHDRLELSTSCVAFDMNMGCSGFGYGLNTVAALLSASDKNKALLLCGDLSAQNYAREMSRGSLLFGDAGAAILIEKTNSESDTLTIYSSTDGKGRNYIITPSFGCKYPEMKDVSLMDGVEVFNFATRQIPEMLNEYMSDMGTSPEDYDKLVLHQANVYIMKQVTKRSNFPDEKMSVSLDKYGNTSSVSIPVSIVNDYGDENSDDVKRVLTCGFGIGLSWDAVEVSISPKDILPMIHTDGRFDDGVPELVEKMAEES